MSLRLQNIFNVSYLNIFYFILNTMHIEAWSTYMKNDMTIFFPSSPLEPTNTMAYYKIKFIEYWIQNCLIPPNKEASELFKGIIEIEKSIF